MDCDIDCCQKGSPGGAMLTNVTVAVVAFNRLKATGDSQIYAIVIYWVVFSERDIDLLFSFL